MFKDLIEPHQEVLKAIETLQLWLLAQSPL